MTRPKILLTNPIDPAGVRVLEQSADVLLAPKSDADTLRRLAADVDGIIVRAQLPGDIFDHAHRLCGVVRHGVGMDMIPVEAATAHGIPVANVPGVNAEAVAEYCVSGMLLVVRRMHLIDRDLRATDWDESRRIADRATELAGRTVGVIGVGSVGTRIAEICHRGFCMRVLGHQRRLDALPAFVEGVSLDALLGESDFVVLACPLTDETRNLIDAQRLARMKPGACLINVARGPIVDEEALVRALREQRLGGAVLDVFANQPLPRDHPLLGMDNVILTPHAAGITTESMRQMSESAARDLLRIIAGERPVNFVNPRVWGAYIARRRTLGLEAAHA
ncbi:MAG TPA: hydroxyacid dehydrogenase [Burkholderiales bacterium]|nr:hydroxyacid dehydrogenase [Burkholderiales bacterium]